MTPSPRLVRYLPMLEGFEPSRVRGYPIETTVAEKVSIMVERGALNTRCKDYFDISLLSRRCRFDARRLWRAIGRTFAQRKLPLPAEGTWPLAAAAATDARLQREWTRYTTATPRLAGRSWSDTIVDIQGFIAPLAARHARSEAMSGAWPAGGPWRFA